MQPSIAAKNPKKIDLNKNKKTPPPPPPPPSFFFLARISYLWGDKTVYSLQVVYSQERNMKMPQKFLGAL